MEEAKKKETSQRRSATARLRLGGRQMLISWEDGHKAPSTVVDSPDSEISVASNLHKFYVYEEIVGSLREEPGHTT